VDFLKLFWWMENSKGIPTSHCTQDYDTFFVSCDILFFFFSNNGMLSAIAIWQKLPEFAQSCHILPKFAQTISLRNFKIPPKFEILMFFQKKKLPYVEEAPKLVLTV
jgi:hypothetical protein